MEQDSAAAARGCARPGGRTRRGMHEDKGKPWTQARPGLAAAAHKGGGTRGRRPRVVHCCCVVETNACQRAGASLASKGRVRAATHVSSGSASGLWEQCTGQSAPQPAQEEGKAASAVGERERNAGSEKNARSCLVRGTGCVDRGHAILSLPVVRRRALPPPPSPRLAPARCRWCLVAARREHLRAFAARGQRSSPTTADFRVGGPGARRSSPPPGAAAPAVPPQVGWGPAARRGFGCCWLAPLGLCQPARRGLAGLNLPGAKRFFKALTFLPQCPPPPPGRQRTSKEKAAFLLDPTCAKGQADGARGSNQGSRSTASPTTR